MNYKYPLFWPHVSLASRFRVFKTMGTRWIGQGPQVDQFEKDIIAKFNRNFAVSVNSGTSALELAYDLVGFKKGDEVITSALTCTATNIPLLRRGVKIVFADIKRDTLNIDPEDIKRRITSKTKAIVNINLGGVESNLNHLETNLPIITDSAQGIGLTNGDYVIYSFQAIKHFTTADGGMLFCPNWEVAHRAKLLRWFGIDRDKKRSYDWQAYKEREMTFDIEEPGYKYQMHDIAAAMGIEGLKEYDKILKHRKDVFEYYKNHIHGDKFLGMIDGKKNVYWLATLLVEDRDAFVKTMTNHGIETNLVQVRNDAFSVFSPRRKDLPNLDWIENRYISIPLHTKISLNDAKYITKVINGGW